MISNDDSIRLQALDPKKSFIVQAPAGSGKTELLMQRYLKLLSCTNKVPEEIIALTFTRKAAAEMRQRILNALIQASKNASPTQPHKRLTQQLAQQVLKRDKQLNWNLLNNPQRLRIQTIDSLCMHLVKRAPWLTQFGGQPNVIENATEYYEQASDNLLKQLEENEIWNSALQTLLLHRDNDFNKIKKLFIDMLAKRDQWLPHIVSSKYNKNLRKELEQSLKNLVTDALAQAKNDFPKNLKDNLIELAHYAGEQLDKDALKFKEIPGTTLNDYSHWKALSELLSTNKGQWRKKITKNDGFPAGNKIIISKMKNLLDSLAHNDGLLIALNTIKQLPVPQYTTQQWELVEALIELLPILAAQLRLIFRFRGDVDFIEITSGALHALGNAQQPTELTLNLDYQIKHLLIDEFQDTSITQYKLIEQLTAGWQLNDGRTLFLVGDPMQSIYRFREAEVGLFLKAREEGIGGIQLTSLQLTTNFRSNKQLIDWFNRTFDKIFPKLEDISTGAISYYPTQGTFNSDEEENVFIYGFEETSEKMASQKIIDIIKKTKQVNSNDSIAILVRAKNHAIPIISALRKEKIDFQATEIEAFDSKPVISDLLALTSALMNPANRIAWLCVLRAPWCGLTLKDIYKLAGKHHKQPLLQQLTTRELLETLSQDAQKRIQRFNSIVIPAIQNRYRTCLSKWIKKIWLKLGGPLYLNQTIELNYAKQFFKLIDELEQNGDIDLEKLENKVTQFYANNETIDKQAIQIMTIHKAKGLEFDTVILPGLQFTIGRNLNPLLLWQERARTKGNPELLLAPIKSVFQKEDSLFKFLQSSENRKNDYETMRLLYVAATRAKNKFYLLFSDGKTQKTGSFLSLLHPIVEPQIQFIKNENKQKENIVLPKIFKRLPHPHLLTTESLSPTGIEDRDLVEIMDNKACLSRQSELTLKHLGTLIHRCLQKLTEKDCSYQKQTKLWRKQLLELGVLPKQIDVCLQKISTALQNTLNDKYGQWILSPHRGAYSEYPITGVIDNEIQHLIIDRTFIDENDTRWIIDYKTAEPFHTNLETFLEEQKQLHLLQLQRYAAVFQLKEKRPIKLALYFPLLPKFFILT